MQKINVYTDRSMAITLRNVRPTKLRRLWRRIFQGAR